jgi:hypothetical protein
MTRFGSLVELKRDDAVAALDQTGKPWRMATCIDLLKKCDPEYIPDISMTQLIEISLISDHFVNTTNVACIDALSCKRYLPCGTAEFS